MDCFHVDAFTDRPFAGNPACVCPLSSWPNDALLAALARENAATATAFFVPQNDELEIRWFSPLCEIELCGHGTLAAAFVITTVLEPDRTRLRFRTRTQGVIEAERLRDWITLDLPRFSLAPCTAEPALIAALGVTSVLDAMTASSRLLLRLRDAEAVRALQPSFAKLLELPDFGGLIVTAEGTGRDADVDFVSRYFAPHHGTSEDPVTGSAHCALTPYWAERLGKTELRARQVSTRGGELGVLLAGDRVRLSGTAVLVKRGTFVSLAR